MKLGVFAMPNDVCALRQLQIDILHKVCAIFDKSSEQLVVTQVP